MQLPDYATLKTEMDEPHVLVVTLNRPEVGNAINTQMGRDFLDLWTRLTEDAGAVRCVVLTGAGERIFCSGGDLKERNGMTKEQWVRQHQLFERQYWTLVDLPVPVIAAVNGHAYAGGLETALSCDFIYAVRSARFALTEVTLGIMPGAGGTQNLPRALGERRAKEIIMTGRPFSASSGWRPASWTVDLRSRWSKPRPRRWKRGVHSMHAMPPSAWRVPSRSACWRCGSSSCSIAPSRSRLLFWPSRFHPPADCTKRPTH